ncbi:MAG TPA: VanZ family protein [Anaeromyxobacteraceae bacterium]|nr:VanZ family protein [Anaeromyxobacteraceae bacterium]
MRRALAWGAVGAYAALVFVLSSKADPLPLLTQNVWDKAIHFLEYGTLGVLLAVALWTSGLPLRRAGVLAAVLASLYGASDEFHQSFVPGREADPRDWLADTLGGASGAVAAAVALRVRAPRASIRRSR